MNLAEALSDVLGALSLDQRAVLIAPPGVGKTTTVPLAISDSGILGGKKILMTEPRRVATRGAAARMAELDRSTLGERVGYSMRGERKVQPSTEIEVLTERTLVRRLQRDPELADIGLIIFDEFHERSLDLDLAVALTLDAIDSLAPHVNVLAMSATIDADEVAAFLDASTLAEAEAPAHRVDTIYVPRTGHGTVGDRMGDVLPTIMAETDEFPRGDVLVFLPGRREIRQTQRALSGSGLHIEVLTGGTSTSDLRRILADTPHDRRIILATSVAESSITIPGVRVVVDSGLSRVHRHDPTTGIGGLVTDRSSVASVDQRRGRAGRLAPGRCYRMWNEASQSTRDAFPIPEVLTAELTSLVLECSAWGVTDPDELRWLVSPAPEHWAAAVSTLEHLGALSDGHITSLGKTMQEVPSSAELASMMLRADVNERRTATLVAAVVEDGSGGDIEALVERPTSAIRTAAKQLERSLPSRIQGAHSSSGASVGRPDDVRSVGHLTALAYPRRIARRRGSSDSYLLASGSGGQLNNMGTLRSSEWIVAAGVDARSGDSLILSAAPISGVDALEAGKSLIAEELVPEFNEGAGTVKIVEVRRLGRIELFRREPTVPVGVELAAAAARLIERLGIDALGWSKNSTSLAERLAYLGTVDPSAPMIDADTIARVAAEILPTKVGSNATKLRLRDLSAGEVLSALIDYPTRRALDELAPERVALANSMTASVDYSGDVPSIALRLQQLLGIAEHPALPHGTPLKIDVLSPAGRSLQITSNLAEFWTGSYSEVRKEMRGRYPKHIWPEDPASAQPTSRAKRPKRA